MPDDILAAIDAAVHANLCACSCGSQLPPDGPSADFLNETHQADWNARGRSRPERPDWEPCHMPECDGSHRYTARVTTQTPKNNGKSVLLRAIDRIRGITR